MNKCAQCGKESTEPMPLTAVVWDGSGIVVGFPVAFCSEECQVAYVDSDRCQVIDLSGDGSSRQNGSRQPF